MFWLDADQLAVLEPHQAQRVSIDNWRELCVPDRTIDLLRRRSSPQVKWSRIRAAWRGQLRTLNTAEANAALVERMSEVLSANQGSDVDLVMLAQQVMIESVLPVVLAGLTEREDRRIRAAVDRNVRWLLGYPGADGTRAKLRLRLGEVQTGLIVRRVLRQRASGRRSGQPDLADPIVALRPELGADRALNVVTGVLAAISGPPGASAACLWYELARQQHWFRRVSEELCAVNFTEFCTAPIQAAPQTYRFVKETLRLWSAPALFERVARQDHDLGDCQLARGQLFLLSPSLIHRDPRVWSRPEVFDPDRFLPGAPHGPRDRDSYVPFGWAPRECVGADIGTTQLMALCLLLCTRFRFKVPDVERLRMTYRFAPLPMGMRATVRAVAGTTPDVSGRAEAPPA